MCRVSIQDPKQIISCIDFRYITDVLTEEEALGETRSWHSFRSVHPLMDLNLHCFEVFKDERNNIWIYKFEFAVDFL